MGTFLIPRDSRVSREVSIGRAPMQKRKINVLPGDRGVARVFHVKISVFVDARAPSAPLKQVLILVGSRFYCRQRGLHRLALVHRAL